MNEYGSGPLLTSSKTADLLGIHSSTVKRWCDDGTLRSERTEGGHRRIRLGDALEAGRDRGISTFLDPFHPWEANAWLAISEAEERGDFRRLHHLALGWLSRGETELMGRLLFELARRPSLPFHIFLDEGVRGFMTLVGEEWRQGRLAVGEEHMASQMVLEVLLRLRPGWDQPLAHRDGLAGSNREELADLQAAGDHHGEFDGLPSVAVVGSMEGDHHDLGAQAIRVLLEKNGWKVYYLGADVPVEDFAEIQRAQGASLVCISISLENALPDVQRVIRVLGEFYRPGYPYALGLGGGMGALSEESVPEGPFLSLSISTSAEDFQTWVRGLAESQDSQDPRRAA